MDLDICDIVRLDLTHHHIGLQVRILISSNVILLSLSQESQPGKGADLGGGNSSFG